MKTSYRKIYTNKIQIKYKENELTQTISELVETENELTGARDELREKENEMMETISELAGTQNKLAGATGGKIVFADR